MRLSVLYVGSDDVRHTFKAALLNLQAQFFHYDLFCCETGKRSAEQLSHWTQSSIGLRNGSFNSNHGHRQARGTVKR
jgi:hypothetical protein